MQLISRLVLVLFAAALVWYGAMLLLLALGVDPSTVNSLSGYRSAFDWAAAIDEPDVTDDVRIITGLSGAGRSEAAKSLEDLGYFVVDNLPPALIPKFAELVETPAPA